MNTSYKQQEIQSRYQLNTVVTRWVLVDNQETCHWELVHLIDGWWSSKEDAKAACILQKGVDIFKESLFTVKPIEFCESYWQSVMSCEKYRYDNLK